MSERKTITISQAAYDELAVQKREGESWSNFLVGLVVDAAEAPTDDDGVDLTDEQHTKLVDDIATATTRQVRDEIEDMQTGFP